MFREVPEETAIPVFYLVLSWHDNVAISLSFVTFLKDIGRPPYYIWCSSFCQFPDIHKTQKKTFPVRFRTNKTNMTPVEFISANINY